MGVPDFNNDGRISLGEGMTTLGMLGYFEDADQGFGEQSLDGQDTDQDSYGQRDNDVVYRSQGTTKGGRWFKWVIVVLVIATFIILPKACQG